MRNRGSVLSSHDVTQVPFPDGPVDLLYSRFLLTHLSDHRNVLDRWATQLHDQGLLMLEEVEAIDTDNEVFRLYLEIVEAMLAEQSQNLYIGRDLSSNRCARFQ